MKNDPFTTHSKGVSSGAKAKTKKMPQEQETRGSTSYVEPPKKGKRGRKPDLVKRAEKEFEKALKEKERQKQKRERAIIKAQRKAYEDWWKQNTKTENQKAREAAKRVRDSIKQQDKEAAKIQKEIDKATKREAIKEAKKREQAARKAEIKEFRNFVKDLKNNMKTWSDKNNLSQDALNAVLKQIPGVELTDKGNISAAKSDRRNEEMRQALKNMLKDKKSFANALKNSPFWDTDRKRQLWYRIQDMFDKDALSPLKWGSLGYREIMDKFDDLEIAVIQSDLVLANRLMDELDKLLDEAQAKLDAGNVTEDYNYDDDYDNF